MTYHLVCRDPFGKYAAGQIIEDQDEVNQLIEDREHHFVRVNPPEPKAVAPVEENKPAPAFLTAKTEGK